MKKCNMNSYQPCTCSHKFQFKDSGACYNNHVCKSLNGSLKLEWQCRQYIINISSYKSNKNLNNMFSDHFYWKKGEGKGFGI